MSLFYRHKGNPSSPKLRPLTVQQCFYLSTLNPKGTAVDKFDITPMQLLREIVKMSYYSNPTDNLSFDSVVSAESLDIIYTSTFGEPDKKIEGPLTEESSAEITSAFLAELNAEEMLRGKFMLMYYLHLTPDQVDNMPYFEFIYMVGQLVGLSGKKGS